MKNIILVLFYFLSIMATSQNEREKKEIVDSYNKQDVSQTKSSIKAYLNKKSLKINNYLAAHPEVKRKIITDQNISILHEIVNDKPIYITTNNIIGLEGARTNFIQPNGKLGLDLEGEDMTLAYWEVGGTPLTSHNEFMDNNVSRIIISEEIIDTTFHATHVAGTLIASGFREEAKGMAPKAMLKSYDQTNDLIEAENEATSNGLLISNHSYGVPVSNLLDEEWRMGAYDTEAQKWDEIANNAPYYLSVFSAGNSGNTEYEGGLKSGFDKLTSATNAKNNLVVANAAEVKVNADGDITFGSDKLNSSSSQGPSDDGRVKPDITGMGTGILSTSSITESTYKRATGTSMSGPNVAGSLVLLQEFYNKEFGNFMLASTLKCLVLNTATNGGFVDGPDARYGWGIIDVRKAANTIIQKKSSNSIIHEDVLNNNETKTFSISAKGNNEELRVMIVWNDPAGEVIEEDLNNPTPALVNDLDLRVTSESETFFPWKLSLDDVSAAATKGDNSVDNVEQIIIKNPTSESIYTISISHKSNLTGDQQQYSLVVTGINSSTLNTKDFTEETIALWPNPVKNQLNISSSEIIFSDDVQVSVYDILGREVMNRKEFNSSSHLSLDTSSLTKGIYILKLTDGSKSIQKRIIKE